MKVDLKHVHPLRYCVVDNMPGSMGTVCLCFSEEQARKICDGLYAAHQTTEEEFYEDNDYYRFAYEDLRDYTADPHLITGFMMQLALAFEDYHT